MPEFIIGARGHDFGRQTPEALFSAIGQAGFRCTQLAFTKAIEGVKSYADVLPIVKAAAPGRQCQHRHAAVAVALKLHGAVQHRAPFLIINTIHTQTQ